MRRLRRLRRLSLTGWALLLGAPLDAVAQLEVLVEGAAGADGTASLTFEARTAPTFRDTNLGPGRSFTDAGQRIGSGAGRLITPTVTKLKLPTETSAYPEVFYDLTKDAQGRVWVRHSRGLYVFSEGSSWRRVNHDLGSWVKAMGRDARGGIWAVGSLAVWHISGDSLTVYENFGKRVDLYSFAGGRGDTVWVGGYEYPEHLNTTYLLRFDGGPWRQYGSADELPQYGYASALAVDSTGTVWAGVADAREEWDPEEAVPPPPLISYDGREWREYSFDVLGPSFSSPSYEARLVVDPGGTLWVERGSHLIYKTSSGWVDYNISGILMTAGAADQVWLERYGQIGVFEKGGKWRYFVNDGSSDVFAIIRGMYYDGAGVLWMGSRRMGRWRLPRRSTSIEQEMGSGPSYRFGRLDSYPNPFNGRTTIAFEVDRSQPLSLRIHNVAGQRVTTLAEGVYPEGMFAVAWDGRDDLGQEVASGLYLCRLRTPLFSQTRKMILLR